MRFFAVADRDALFARYLAPSSSGKHALRARARNERVVTLYHLADHAHADLIDRDGFIEEPGTYKQTGIDLHGVFFSATLLDSNEDHPGNVVFAIDLPPEAIETYEIIEADSDHRKYAIPAAVANGVPRKRLTTREARAIPVVDRKTDPAYPLANDTTTG